MLVATADDGLSTHLQQAPRMPPPVQKHKDLADGRPLDQRTALASDGFFLTCGSFQRGSRYMRGGSAVRDRLLIFREFSVVVFVVDRALGREGG